MNADQFSLDRVGIVMQTDQADPNEAWGVLNPGGARTRDGKLWLYPRAVAEGNFSRIERVLVEWDDGLPCGVTDKRVVLEPTEDYEHDVRQHGGVEDPRITFVRPLNKFVMSYVALSARGPRVAVAVSDDGLSWQRQGLVRFAREGGIDFSDYGDKDAMFFPEAVVDPQGRPALALLHRPTYLVPKPDGTVEKRLPPGIEDDRGSIWISYLNLEEAKKDSQNLTTSYHSSLVATPQADWEALKIGAGTPPLLTSKGWLVYYHGVSGVEDLITGTKDVCYRAGAMLLDRDDPRRVLYRSAEPVLSPLGRHERSGIVSNVVFPTAIDVVGQRIFVYYGAADCRIGVATTELDVEVAMPPSASG